MQRWTAHQSKRVSLFHPLEAKFVPYEFEQRDAAARASLALQAASLSLLCGSEASPVSRQIQTLNHSEAIKLKFAGQTERRTVKTSCARSRHIKSTTWVLSFDLRWFSLLMLSFFEDASVLSVEKVLLV